MATLTVSNLHKSHSVGSQNRKILHKINLDLLDGGFVSIVGASGCGKSTLLQAIAGLERIDSGSICVDKIPIRGAGIDRGLLFQSYNLLPWLSAQGNIEFALKAAGYNRSERSSMAREYLRLVNLEEFADTLPGHLSGGMQQRVALARVLSYKPKILLMDEPFSSLDAITQHQMRVLLLDVHQTHRLTVLFVTHNISEAIYLSNRIVVMSMEGKIKAELNVGMSQKNSSEAVYCANQLEMHQQVLSLIREDMQEKNNKPAH